MGLMLHGDLPEWADAFGSGYGSGSGSGSGSGYGDGSGDGYGYGDKRYWRATIANFATRWTPEQRLRLHDLHEQGAVIAFWKSDKHGRACNGGTCGPVKPGQRDTIPGPLELCSRHALHATFLPPKWQGARTWVVALIGDVQCQDDKVGALTREIIGEAA